MGKGNKVKDLFYRFHNYLKATNRSFRIQEKYEDMTVEEFCKEMNCTTEYFEYLCKEMKKIFEYSDDECIEYTKLCFFGGHMPDIDIEETSNNLQKVMEKYEHKNGKEQIL